jgi:hypothetical protein
MGLIVSTSAGTNQKSKDECAMVDCVSPCFFFDLENPLNIPPEYYNRAFRVKNVTFPVNIYSGLYHLGTMIHCIAYRMRSMLRNACNDDHSNPDEVDG